MEKTARLKEWHTLQDAARYLSNKLKDEISAADILQFGLQGDLKLSFNFVNVSPAAIGIIGSTAEGKKILGFPQWHGAIRWFWLPHRSKTKRPEPAPDSVCEFRDEIDWIDGVWDLLMIEDAVHAVTRLFQKLTGGPDVKSRLGDGIVVVSADGKFARLQVAAETRDIHPHHRHNYKLSRELPAGDGVVVVRDTALIEFEARMHARIREKSPDATANSNSDEATEHKSLPTAPPDGTADSASSFFRRGHSPDDEWKKEAWRIANEVASEQSRLGIQQITARSIGDKVAERLNKNSKFHGARGPRTGNTVRSEALKGWK